MQTIQWKGDKEWNVTKVHVHIYGWNSAYLTLCGLVACGYINLDASQVTCKNCLRLRKILK